MRDSHTWSLFPWISDIPRVGLWCSAESRASNSSDEEIKNNQIWLNSLKMRIKGDEFFVFEAGTCWVHPAQLQGEEFQFRTGEFLWKELPPWDPSLTLASHQCFPHKTLPNLEKLLKTFPRDNPHLRSDHELCFWARNRKTRGGQGSSTLWYPRILLIFVFWRPLQSHTNPVHNLKHHRGFFF